MHFTFKQKIFALLVASLFLRFVFFAVENGDALSAEFNPKLNGNAEARLNSYRPPPPPAPYPYLPPPPAPSVATVKPIVIEQAVKLFHKQFNDTKFDLIYAGAGKGIRSYQTREEFVRKLYDKRKELGAAESSKRVYINEDDHDGYTRIVTDYHTVFTNGEIKEESFFWRIVKGEPKLDYYIVSPVR